MKTEITPGDVVRIEGIDVPEGARFHYVKNKDMRLRVMIAPSSRKAARGSVIFQPGRTEFIEKFFETADELLKRGFAVLIYDPRGQGFSDRLLDDRLKCYVRDYEDYCDDLAFVTETFSDDLPRPHIVMGHSMGGVVGLQTILTGRLNPAACVFSAPMLELHDVETPFIGMFVKVATMTGFKHHKLPFQAQRSGQPVPYKANKLTTDPARYKIWATYFENYPKLRLGPPTFGWINASLRAMKFVNTNAVHLNIPTLIASCGGDPIVTPKSNAEFAKKAGADYINIPGALHEILLEKDEYRDQFWAKFDSFLDKHAL